MVNDLLQNYHGYETRLLHKSRTTADFKDCFAHGCNSKCILTLSHQKDIDRVFFLFFIFIYLSLVYIFAFPVSIKAIPIDTS